MTDTLARVMFGVTVVILVPVLAFLYLSSRPSSSERQVIAQFEDAFPLVEGMNVRVGGAVAGSVGPIEVGVDGLANVTLLLDEGVEQARADATAGIRQQDTTGDSYVAFDPGSSRRALAEKDGTPTIACRSRSRAAEARCPNTLVAPRFDDLLNAFGPSERAGIQLTLTELARAVDRRGGDLNRAALDLRPGLVAVNRALVDVNRQNAALRSVIGDAEAVAGQAAARRRRLAHLIESLAATLEATAAETPSLDAGLRSLAPTARRATRTLAAVRHTAVSATPLAETLRDGAPLLSTALRRAPGFLGDTRSFVTRTEPTLDRTRHLLVAATPAIVAQPKRFVTGPFDLAPAISNLLRGVLGEDETIEALFNKDYGLGAAAAEPGDQATYPAAWADRNFLRISAVLNCEAFGAPVEPGCLLKSLAAARGGDRAAPKEPRRASRKRRRRPAPAAPGAERPAPRPQPTVTPKETATPIAPPIKPVPVPGLPPLQPQKTVEDVLDLLLGP